MEEIPNPNIPAKSSSKKWIFLGCGGCLVFIALGVVAVAVMIFGVFGMIKSSGAYQDALARVKASPEVTGALGTPIEAGFFVTGNVSSTTTSGDADISFSVTGPNGNAQVHYKGTHSGANWEPSIVNVLVEKDGVAFNLLDN